MLRSVLVPVDPERPDQRAIERAASVLRAGGLVAFPTETVYGLGANALDPAAIARIYAAKGRPTTNPLIVHVADATAARELVATWPAAAESLARAFWPGPLTLVLPKRALVPDAATAGLPAVGVRVPAHAVALALIRAAGVPIAAPSANRSTDLSPVSAAHVERSLGDRVDVILDGGPARVGIESTVVDLTGPRPRILRPGLVSATRIAAIVGPLAEPPRELATDAPRLAPGHMERHYAPRARLVLANADDASVVALVRAARARGEIVGLVSLGDLELPADVAARLPCDPARCAAGLYATLHAFDDEGCALVVFEAPPLDPAWDAVRDRLTRASTPP
ncbi:MAG: L-threonylcarbamoyladenylate synthase [Planctomycetota bacterium]|nr:L-threonylcarbamoyladenylate synthase [Planctomycetota bacterium]